MDMVMTKPARVSFSGIVGDRGDVALVLSRCGGLWGVDRLLGVMETGFMGLDSVGNNTGRVVALSTAQFLTSGLVASSDVVTDVLGVFSVIDGLGDVSVMAEGGCGKGRGSVCIATTAVVGLDLFSGSRDAPSAGSSSWQCS
jgi:hypothetical protein